MDSLVGREIGPYRVEERLGSGGMGVVYRATDLRLDRDVALKFLSARLHADPRARTRLLHEARAVAALDHPHVASVYDVGETADGRAYVAMAYYDGETLAERIDRGPLPADEALGLGLQIAQGLAAAHHAGIVHRDVKPANVMVLPDGMPDGGPCAKVLDFGIAKVDDADLTQTGESVGTALYMSPEQLRGEPVDGRADVWAVGAVLYEMLAGQRPFRGSYAAAIGYAVLHEDPAPLEREDLPDGVAAVVARCLAKSADARYPSMDALAEALDDVRRGTAPSTPPVPPVARAAASGRPPPRPRWRWAVAALGLLAVAALGVAALRSGGTDAGGTERLAVLPFRAVGSDAEPLSAGLVEAVTSKLSHLASLDGRVRIVPSSEVASGMTPSDARERFGASLVIDGAVQVEGGRVRVTITLIDVGTGDAAQLGSREVDDASGSAFALQDAAVLQVADLLRIEVGMTDQTALSAGGTDDPEANKLYLRGLGVLRNHQSTDDLAQARSLLREAISLDPSFALAHAALAEAEWQTYRLTEDLAWTDRAIASAERALALDDGLAEVHTVLGNIYEGRGEYDRALASLDRALTLDPRSSEGERRLGKVYASLGRPDEAEAAYRRAVALAPDYWRPYNSLGAFYLAEGRTEEAADQFRQALQLDPVNTSLLTNLGVAAWQADDLDAAAEAFERVLRLAPDNVQAAQNLLATRFASGEYAEAVEIGERVVALLPDDYEIRYSLAEARRWAPGQRERSRQDYRAVIALARSRLALGRTPPVLITMAGAFAGAGQRDSAHVTLAEVERLLSPETANVQSAYQIGVTYEIIGERPRALVWLQSALDRGVGRTQAERSPWLADLRTTPTFRSILESTP